MHLAATFGGGDQRVQELRLRFDVVERIGLPVKDCMTRPVEGREVRADDGAARSVKPPWVMGPALIETT
jgi:hypothetical protein